MPGTARWGSFASLANAVLLPGFLGRTAPEWLLREVDAGLAGVVLFGHNLGSDAGGSDAGGSDAGGPPAAGLPAGLAGRGLLVGIDEEGGNVTRVEAPGGSTLPGAAQLGAVDDPGATRRVAAAIGRLARSAGANLVFAPVADVNTNPANPVIGVRSFGADAGLVARHVAAAVHGLADAGAIACVKHFPGHGDTAVDSHLGLPVVAATAEELEAVHLEPFRAAVAAGVRAVMTGHLVVPAWGAEPATLNPVALGRLRALGFDGVIVSDALDMAAIRAGVGAGPGAVRALAAGCDLLCLGNPAVAATPRDAAPGTGPARDEADFLEVRNAIVAALERDELAVRRVEEAAARVAALAAEATRAPVPDAGAAPDAEAERARFAGVARRATTVGRAFPPLPAPRTVLDVRDAPTIAVDARSETVARIVAGGGGVLRRVGDDAAAAAAAHAASAAPVVLVDRLADPGQRARMAAIAAARPDAVVVDLGVAAEEEPAPPVVRVRAASRLAAETAGAVLAEGVTA